MASKTTGFSAEEKAAMKERIREEKAAAAHADGDAEVRAKIAGMAEADSVMAERIHATMRFEFPKLNPRTYYGMPAYAEGEKVVFWFKDAGKFKTRYASLEFSDAAKLDEGEIWPVSFALTKLTDATMERIVELVRRALGN